MDDKDTFSSDGPTLWDWVVGLGIVLALVGAIAYVVWAVFIPRAVEAQQGGPYFHDGASLAAISVTSASAATRLDARIRVATSIMVPANAAVAIWVARIQGTCSSAMTAIGGVRIPPGEGYVFLASEGWDGQLCAILESGVTAVSVKVNKW